MATATTTVRLPVTARDALARKAQSKGMSLAAMLSEQAERFTREEWFAAEREASQRDAADPASMAEQELWDTADDAWD
ncbi:MAG: hypothetical protein LBK59_02240 [Bifidobacteriaceae bacterium]|jgi:hypothetical protein|nr:hypothetical protein [Bifidobacteriaceae bacterium]